MTQSQRDDKAKRRAAKTVMAFTDLAIRRLNATKHLDKVNRDRRKRGLGPVVQDLIWDEGQPGLALVIGARSKSFRVQFKLDGKFLLATIGRFGEMVPDADQHNESLQIGEARRTAADWRAKAKQGIDPRVNGKSNDGTGTAPNTTGKTYREVVEQFIAEWAKPRQRSWSDTERALKVTCEAWLDREFRSITKRDAKELLLAIKTEGHERKAAITLAWLRKLWRWACTEDDEKRVPYVDAPIMDAVPKIEYDEKVSNPYKDAEIAAIWKAANQLEPTERAYVKLLLLLAPRKTSLAMLRPSHLDSRDDPTVWVTPFELTKSKKSTKPAKRRSYKTPLPLLAQRILKPLVPRDGDGRIFSTLRIGVTKTGQPVFQSNGLTLRLIAAGAPKDFGYHKFRHSIATWLQNEGHSEWERGLILNHSEHGVTADYSHGAPLDLKLKLLTEWANHVEGLVQPEGVSVLR